MNQPVIRYSCIYLNRSCPRHCEYCSERDAPLKGRELTEPEWEKIITHLDKLGIKFHLFLGNDCLLLGDEFLKLVQFLKGRRDYALYSTMEPRLFGKYKDRLLPGLYNLSAGIDVLTGTGDIAEKSRDGLAGLTWLREHNIPDCQGTITLGNHNIDQVEKLVQTLSERGIYVGINVTHWNQDGGFDFFPEKKYLKDYILERTPELEQLIKNLVTGIKSGRYLIQNPPEYLEGILEHGIDLSWHCSEPHIIAIDADGSLRCCGYRKGRALSRYHVLDLGTQKLSIGRYRELWMEDSTECSGCCWSYAWMAEYTAKTEKYHGDEMFKTHYSPYKERI